MTDYLIKRASVFSEDELAGNGLTGIPANWPVEKRNYIDIITDGFELISESDLLQLIADNQAAYDEWKAAKNPVDSQAYIINSILMPAMAFGQSLINCTVAGNISLGITQAGMTSTVRIALRDINECLMSGSLYDAIAAARALPEEVKDGVFITNARILHCINKIEEYLKLPLSETL